MAFLAACHFAHSDGQAFCLVPLQVGIPKQGSMPAQQVSHSLCFTGTWMGEAHLYIQLGPRTYWRVCKPSYIVVGTCGLLSSQAQDIGEEKEYL